MHGRPRPTSGSRGITNVYTFIHHKRMYKHGRKAPHLQQPRLGGGELALEAGDEGALQPELLLGDAKAALQSKRAFPKSPWSRGHRFGVVALMVWVLASPAVFDKVAGLWRHALSPQDMSCASSILNVCA